MRGLELGGHRRALVLVGLGAVLDGRETVGDAPAHLREPLLARLLELRPQCVVRQYVFKKSSISGPLKVCSTSAPALIISSSLFFFWRNESGLVIAVTRRWRGWPWSSCGSSIFSSR